MTVVTTTVRVSHRYYARKRRRDLLDAIRDLANAAGVPQPVAAYLEGCDRDQLAHVAMDLHGKLPE